MRKIIIVIFVLMLSCSTKYNVGEIIKVVGIAQNAKNGSLIVLENGEVFWLEGIDFTREQHDKAIEVIGLLTNAYDLPVFIHDSDSNTPVRPGIPYPPGTDLKKASHRYLIKNPKITFK